MKRGFRLDVCLQAARRRFAWPVVSRNRLTVMIMLAALSSGCGSGSKDPPLFSVSGKVTLNGAPVESGTIQFIPSDLKGSTSGTAIRDGLYTTSLPKGLMKVEIRSSKIVGTRKVYQTPDSPTEDIVEEQIPEKYNQQTTLELMVDANSKDCNFAL